MANKIHIKLGPIEFEAEGDTDLIERERAQFFSLLPQAMVAVSPVVPITAQTLNEPFHDMTDKNCLSEPTIVMPPTVKSEYQSLAGYLNEKKFSTGVELVMGVAYYLEYVEGAAAFTSKDIENALDEARKGKPGNISQMIIQNIKKGYLRECKEKKDGLKAFCVLDDGKIWCEVYVVPVVDGKKKPSRPKQQKVTNESTLLAIPLDELDLEKYCDIAKLEKFNEQMLVAMLMYTKEKGIEYFSFNDIVSVFKTKFKLPATERKVRYAFDNGGMMFDKKVEKKIAYHKLMSSGIKEAERIIEQLRTTSA